jgi:biotin operon repressor
MTAMQAALNFKLTADQQRAHLVQSLAARHTGRDRGVSAAELAKTLGIGERELRKLISSAREDGVLIAGHPSTGYYIAATAEEVEQYCEFLIHRAVHSLKLVSRAKNIGLPQLLGQLNLPT